MKKRVKRNLIIITLIVVLVIAGVLIYNLVQKNISLSPSPGVAAMSPIENPNYPPRNAIDGNLNTYAMGNPKPTTYNNNGYFMYDIGSIKSLDSITFDFAQWNAVYPGAPPCTYQVFTSTDNYHWTQVYSRQEDATHKCSSTSSYSRAPDVTIPINTPVRYIRLFYTKVNDGTGWSIAINEVGFKEQVIPNPKKIAQINLDNYYGMGSIYVSWNYLYIANNFRDPVSEAYSSILSIYDVSTPSYPRKISGYILESLSRSTQQEHRALFVSGNYVYIQRTYNRDIAVIDVSNPSSPKLVSSYPINEGKFVSFLNGYGYFISRGETYIDIIDFTNPASPRMTSHYKLSDNTAYDGIVYIDKTSGKKYLYVYHNHIPNPSDTMTIVDVSNPYSPLSVGSLGIGYMRTQLNLADKYLFSILNLNTNAREPLILSALDLTNPINPSSILPQYLLPNGDTNTAGINDISEHPLFVSGNYAYTFAQNTFDGGGNRLFIHDISNPVVPRLVATYAFNDGIYRYTPRIFVYNGYAYIYSAPLSPSSMVDVIKL